MSEPSLTIIISGNDGRSAPFPTSTRLLPKELRLLLARGTREVGMQCFDAAMFELLGIPVDPEQDIPLAPVTRLAEGAMETNRWWIVTAS